MTMMKGIKYLIPLILVVSALFFWLNKDPEVITRYSRIFFCSFIVAPGLVAIMLFKYNKWLSCLLFWLGLTTAINLFGGNITFNVASREMLFFLSLTLIFYYIQKVNMVHKLIIKTIAYITLFMAGLWVFQSITGIYFPFEKIEKSMSVGLLDNIPNLAAFFVLGLPFVFYYHWILGIVVLCIIIILGNLTAFIAVLVGLAFLYRSKLVVIAGVFMVIAFIGIFKTQFVTDFSTSSIADRGRIWYESLKITKPVIGWGLGNYKLKMPEYMKNKDIKNMGNQIYDNPSNDYVRGVFEAGFTVLLFIAGFIYTTVKRYNHFKKDKDLNLYFSSFISILVLCIGYSLFLNPTNIIWAVIVIALLNSELNGREKKCCF